VFPLWTREKINALKNLQLKIMNVDADFWQELQDVERKYARIYAPLYEERARIVSGEKDALDVKETTWSYAEDTTVKYDEECDAVNNEPMNELPNYWLRALKATRMLSELILEHDEVVLQHLTDIRCTLNETKPYGYTLEFYFG
jgi:nucleosome assembly protein 1-like 1